MRPKMVDKYITVGRYRISVIWVIIPCLFALVCGLSLAYVKFIQMLTYRNVYHNITELSEQTASQLHLTITNQKKFVEMMVDSIDRGYFDTVEDIFDRFRMDLDSYHFTRLVVLDEAGNGKTSDGYVVENYENITEFFAQDTVYLSENRPSTVTDQQVNIYSKTFDFHGEKMVLFATILTEDYENILSRRLFHGDGGTYLINRDGEVLIDSFGLIHDNHVSLYNYWKTEDHLGKRDLHLIDLMSKNIQAQNVGTFHIRFHEQVHFIHYEKVEVNDWYVVTVAPGSAIAKELNLFLLLSLGLCFLINLILLGVFIYIYFSNRRQNRKLYESAYIDPVTGLGNEVYFEEHGSMCFQNYSENRYVAVMDINRFKAFHQLYGYDFCNSILSSVGQELVRILPDGSVVCHISRDVFAMVFDYALDIHSLCEQIFSSMSQLCVQGGVLQVPVSIGVYSVPFGDGDIHRALDKAYMAHSHLKRLHLAEPYFLFNDELERHILEEQRIELLMEDALGQDEFFVVYQPKVRCSDECVLGAEALVRWKHGDEMIFPNQFIPLFEKNKFILKLDLYVFERVCQDISYFKEVCGEVPIISVNVSKEHFGDEHFIDEYVRIAHQYGIEPNMIELEITESAMFDDGVDVLKILKRIHDCGFLVSIDDFGTGYSSLSMLQDIPMDVLKIDKRFIDIADLSSDDNVINYIVFIAKRMGVLRIAEGVETKEQVDFVRSIGCDMIQGYYYSKPLSRDEFVSFWKEHR